MSDRKYSVHELDDLRRVMENKFLCGSYSPIFQYDGIGCSRSFRENEKVVVVEQMVRTAMLAGHTADDYRRTVSLTAVVPDDEEIPEDKSK